MYETLVLSGGGIHGFEILGSLNYLHEHHLLNNIKIFSGCSVGALICYLMIIGYTPNEILTKIFTSQMLKNLSNFELSNILNNKGICSYKYIYTLLCDLTLKKFNKLLTLQELYDQTGKTLIVSTFNLTDYKQEYFSYKTEPDMLCVDACRASSNIPFLFDDFVYNKCIYIDGGIIDNFPICVPGFKFTKIISVNISYENSKITPSSKLFDKIQNIANANIRYNCTKKVKKLIRKNEDVVDIRIKNKHKFYDFSITSTTCLNKFSYGYLKCKKYFDK